MTNYKSENALTTLGAKRLLKLAAFLRKLPRQKFDFCTFVSQGGLPPLEALAKGKHRCGTVACAIGWMPAVFPRLTEYQLSSDEADAEAVCVKTPGIVDYVTGFAVAREVFGIDELDSHFLFDPGWISDDDRAAPGANATPKQVARHIERFVKMNYAGKAQLDFSAA